MGYPHVQGWGTPMSRMGYTPGIRQHMKYLIRHRQYAFCVHTGGHYCLWSIFDCFLIYQFHFHLVWIYPYADQLWESDGISWNTAVYDTLPQKNLNIGSKWCAAEGFFTLHSNNVLLVLKSFGSCFVISKFQGNGVFVFSTLEYL